MARTIIPTSVLIFYHKTRLSRLVDKYERTRDDSLNDEFQRTCRILQELDPNAPTVPPPHISEMVSFTIIEF